MNTHEQTSCSTEGCYLIKLIVCTRVALGIAHTSTNDPHSPFSIKPNTFLTVHNGVIIIQDHQLQEPNQTALTQEHQPP